LLCSKRAFGHDLPVNGFDVAQKTTPRNQSPVVVAKTLAAPSILRY
jgi:hypothetical protein